MAGRFDGKVVLVTGASSGIGKATAIAFGREGAQVVVAARRPEESLNTVAAIKAAGGEAIFVRTDVSIAADVEHMVAQAVATYGRLDCAFNNAGVGSPGIKRLHEYTEEDWDLISSINEKGVWLCMKYEIAQMLGQEPASDTGARGVIVNNSSVAGSSNKVASSARASATVWSTDSTTPRLASAKLVASSRRIPLLS